MDAQLQWNDYASQKRADPRATWDLINLALAETDEDARWEPIEVLHFRGTLEVLDAARELCASACAFERKLGADVLGQLGVPERSFPVRCATVLLDLLRNENDEDVLQTICIALGHLADPRAIEPLLLLKNHPSDDLRYAIVYGLMPHADVERVIHTLIEFSRDTDADVRDWATFSLGSQSEADSPAIRQALMDRLNDDDADTRCEAFMGLARRRDARIVPRLLEELASEDVGSLAIEAAIELGDDRLLHAVGSSATLR